MAAWTTRSLLGWTVEAFARRGIDSARLDAELLLGDTLQMDRLRLFMEYDRPASRDECDRYRALVQRRLEGVSTAAILGRREFYGREFVVGEGVLIPRPETEGLVDRILDRCSSDSLRFVDLGTGSGCIGITLACERPDWDGMLVEKDATALAFARQNQAALAPEHALQIVYDDALQPEPWAQGRRFDLLVANPPYLTRSERESAAPEVLGEPLEALCYGDNADGADWYRALASILPDVMAGEGWLALEIGIRQGAIVSSLLKDVGATAIEIQRDFADHERFVLARWSKDH